jgi:osmotically-inducible protein OsmY
VDNRIAVKPRKPLSDIEMAKRVMSALAISPVTSGEHVVAKASGGKVTLTGTVGSSLAKVDAEYVASGVRGVSAISNELEVAHPTVGLEYDPYLL